MSLMDLIKDKMWDWFSVAASQTDLERNLLFFFFITRSTAAANCFLSPLHVALISFFSLGLNYADKDSVSSEDITRGGCCVVDFTLFATKNSKQNESVQH